MKALNLGCSPGRLMCISMLRIWPFSAPFCWIASRIAAAAASQVFLRASTQTTLRCGAPALAGLYEKT